MAVKIRSIGNHALFPGGIRNRKETPGTVRDGVGAMGTAQAVYGYTLGLHWPRASLSWVTNTFPDLLPETGKSLIVGTREVMVAVK